MDKIRIRKSVGDDIEVIAKTLDVKPIQLLHTILESWIVDRKIDAIRDKTQ